ncbi:MAG TPA: MASE1 domain-containing protein [Gemmatimonadales bacterium]|jgi:diguanylate cyclase (GGDEF)-like protein|nr:MASE1 domain-containing protein [Gemmatimonadales bacterium]
MRFFRRPPPPGLRLAAWLGLATVYIVAGKLGLELAFLVPSATPVWPPTGIAIAALVLYGRWLWPAVFAGAFVVNLTTAGTVWTSLAIAGGNTLEAVVGATLVARWAGGAGAARRSASLVAMFALAGLGATAIAATVGSLTIVLGHVSGRGIGWVWSTWWLGDAVGAIVVTPLLLLWARRPGRINRAALPEGGLLFVALLLAAGMAFDPGSPWAASRAPIEFLCVPPLFWAAFRFGPRITSLGIILVAVIAVNGTLHGTGPFVVNGSPNTSLLMLQAFLGVVSITTLLLAAAATERHRAERLLRLRSTRDPLTGLLNYRELMAVLGAEIRRCLRTGRGFAILFLDLDGLKTINDRLGHGTGSRALCRLADALRDACRAADTLARYGGDEFAVVMPEGDADAALQAAGRIIARLAADSEPPKFTASYGMALFPQDGDTPEALLGKADVALYKMKDKTHRISNPRGSRKR